MRKGYKIWDAAEHIHSVEDAVLYLNAAIEEEPGDGSLIRLALGDIAKAYSMSKIARETGLDRSGVYKALSENGNPSLATTIKIARALGLRLRFESDQSKAEGGHVEVISKTQPERGHR